MMRIVTGLAAAALLTLDVSAASAQDTGRRWYAELNGGYATSTDASFDSPGGGPAVTGFIGYRLNPVLTLGAVVGYHQFVNGVTSNPTSCLPPAAPSVNCTTEYDQDEDALEFSAALRLMKATGTWRPFAQLGVGYYRSNRSLEISQFDEDGNLVSTSGRIESGDDNGAGASLGLGVGYAPGGGRWNVNASTRFHGVLANASGDVVWNTWLGFGLGVGVEF